MERSPDTAFLPYLNFYQNKMESYHPIVIRFHLFIIITIKPLVIFYLLYFL